MAPKSRRTPIDTPFVWGKAVRKHKAKLQENVHALFADIEAAEKQEEQELRGQDLSELGESAEQEIGKWLSVRNDCGTRNRLGQSCKARKATLWPYVE
ncbi:hypothetical protein GCM10010912_49240 [Paenibacillus albidus]|uniref:Uncharacterized protein n=1 Tax=Paenibacillus albidus TaxID=2041023 RepID=A0A917CV58_9BACL|nr:hypothetical protein [Paenibacillus albidus]GGF98693.1 hypothetical protein GCM10010912_49240 [Paenibacillus albidus]